MFSFLCCLHCSSISLDQAKKKKGKWNWFIVHVIVLYSGIFGIGTDSNITVNPFDELRWLEYGQRLHCQNRNLLCDDLSLSTGRNLYKLATAGGAQAIGRKTGVIKVGHKADLIVVDTDQPTLFGRDDDTLLDTLIFSNIHEGVRDVYVGGIQVIKNKRHRFQNEIIKNYLSTLKALSL